MRTLAAVLLVTLVAACGSPGDRTDGAATQIVATAERPLNADESELMTRTLAERLKALGARGSIRVEGDEVRVRLTQGDSELFALAARTTGELQFRPVLVTLSAGEAEVTADPAPDVEAVLPELDGDEVIALYRVGPVVLDHTIVRSARAVEPTTDGGWTVTVEFTDEGAVAFDELAARLVGQQLAIVVDDRILTAPVIREANFLGTAVISGGQSTFGEDEAKALAAALTSNPLPVDLVSVRSLDG